MLQIAAHCFLSTSVRRNDVKSGLYCSAPKKTLSIDVLYFWDELYSLTQHRSRERDR
jgi:hypothetical protein